MGREFLLLVGLLGVPVLVAGMVREAAAVWRILQMRKRDGGTLSPRCREEFLLLFPRACPECLSRDLLLVRGWHLGDDGTREWVSTDRCARCPYVRGERLPSPVREAGMTATRLRAAPRWFVPAAEAWKIAPPGARAGR